MPNGSLPMTAWPASNGHRPMSLLLQALKQIDARPESAAMPAEQPSAGDLPQPTFLKLSSSIVSPPATGASADTALDSLASRLSPPSAPSTNSGFGGAAHAPTLKSSGDSTPRTAAARAIADVATDDQRQLADDVLSILAGPKRFLALLAVDAPSDVCALAGDLALGFAARETGDALLIGSAAGEARQTVTDGFERSLAEVVSGRMTWTDSIISSGIEHLSLLERGIWADEQSLAPRRFAEAWRSLPRLFHQVVIDAGSAGIASPSPLLSACDAILLVVRLGATLQARLDEALARLRLAGLSPSGCLALAGNERRVA